MNLWDLTPHQLDVIRTLMSIVGAIGGFLGGIGAVGAFLARYWAKKAAHNTTSRDWKAGVLVSTPVAETARHAAIAGEATRQGISDLAGWVKGPGRRRLPTLPIPEQRNVGPDIPQVQEPFTYE